LPVADPTPERPLPTIWELPDELWERIESILDRRYPPAGTGRPRSDLRLVLDGVIHRMRRTIAWLQRCRAILIRYDKKAENYEGLIQLACALLWFRRLERLNRRDRVFG
jgi:transposase